MRSPSTPSTSEHRYESPGSCSPSPISVRCFHGLGMEGPLASRPSLRLPCVDHGPGARDRDADSCDACCATVRVPRARVGRRAHGRWWADVVRALRLGLLCVLVSGAVASDIRCSFVSAHRPSGRPSSARGASPACAMRWRGLTPLRFANTRPTWHAPLSQPPPCSWCEPESSAFLRDTSWSVPASGATTSSCRRGSSHLLRFSTPLH